MIIEFSKNLALSDWVFRETDYEIIWRRSALDYDGKSYQDLVFILIKINKPDIVFINFFDELHHLKPLFFSRDTDIFRDIEAVKEYVDNFLIRMSNLKAFV